MRLLDASKGMIELWPNKYDEVKGVKIYYRITTYSTEKDKLDRIAWISTHGDLVSLTGQHKDFVMKVWGDNTDDYYTETRIYGGAYMIAKGLLMNWDGNVTKKYFTVGDEIHLDVPSGTITMKILELKWAPPQYDRILLEKVKVDYEIVLHDPPNLIVTGGLPYYDEPLQVFLKGSEVYDRQQPLVSVQNPYEYTYIVEYWNDTNNNYDIDGGDRWEKESTFNDKTTSDSEFDLKVQDLPVGLYRVRIEGTDYWSNNFYVILNPFDSFSGLPIETRRNYRDHYWLADIGGNHGCAKLVGIPYWICRAFPNRFGATKLRNHEHDMLLTVASIWKEHKHPVNEEVYMIEQFNTFLAAHMDRLKGTLPPSDIIEYIQKIKSGGDSPIGDCDGFAVFLVALARTSGIPARCVYGHGGDGTVNGGGHVWVEAFYDGEWHVWDP
ncbi:Transglutaminase-like enzyme, putative cysteine protease, partial [Candidatus Methanophagaceae archaeon]